MSSNQPSFVDETFKKWRGWNFKDDNLFQRFRSMCQTVRGFASRLLGRREQRTTGELAVTTLGITRGDVGNIDRTARLYVSHVTFPLQVQRDISDKDCEKKKDQNLGVRPTHNTNALLFLCIEISFNFLYTCSVVLMGVLL
eukprot:TRINITY_DN5910_c0_g1_i9.p1 TRINITY_DN5910_c0_g1~~TRINITY_DN5910_c0_g1_i9.p1  ORF type:complete len:141 (+),score=11.26 TRINITY_DN5910_c0_g1_i9:47-469(+)